MLYNIYYLSFKILQKDNNLGIPMSGNDSYQIWIEEMVEIIKLRTKKSKKFYPNHLINLPQDLQKLFVLRFFSPQCGQNKEDSWVKVSSYALLGINPLDLFIFGWVRLIGRKGVCEISWGWDGWRDSWWFVKEDIDCVGALDIVELFLITLNTLDLE